MRELIKSYSVHGLALFRVTEPKTKKVTYSVDDSSGNFADFDNFHMWGNVVKGISSLEDATKYCEYLCKKDEKVEYSVWKKMKR